MFKNNKLTNAVRFALIAGVATSTIAMPSAFAAEEEVKEEIERVSVTGSRIKRTDLETSSSVVTTSALDIKTSGFTNLEDVLNSLPQLEASETSFLANGASGNATLDLRGLGSNRTLVLVNGRRLQPGGINSQASDINQIPSALVKRVDVLTGGASSTYGADAVAGVVNFIMDNDFEGVELNVGAGGYQHNNDNSYIQGLMDEQGFDYDSGNTGIDGKSYNIDLTIGGDFADGKGHATVYGVWNRSDALLQGSRDYASCALNDGGTACGGSGTADIPNFYFYPVDAATGEVDYTTELFNSIDENSLFTDETNLYNFAPVNHFKRPNERFTLGSFIDYQINDDHKLYLEVNYMNDSTAAQIAESGTFFNEEFSLDYNNPYISDAQKLQLQAAFGQDASDTFVGYIGKRNTEGGAREDNLEHNSFRIVTGIEGDINDEWSYDVNFQYGSTASSSVYKNDLLAPNIGPRIGAVGTECIDDCLAYDVFTYEGVTAEQAAQLSGTGIITGTTSQLVLSGFASGELELSSPLAESPIAVVLGAEYREVDFESTSDTVYAEGLLLGQGGETPSLAGNFDVSEIFGELSLPVIEDAEFAESLIIDLGARYSDYSTTGDDLTYKVGVDWTVVEGWKLRTSYNVAVRAPNVSELFSSQNLGLWSGSDLCSTQVDDEGNSITVNSQAQCLNTGVTASQYGTISPSPASQYNQLTGGNTDLVPEEAKTLTVGIVASPFENFNFSVDYFNIEMDNVIGSVGSSLILQSCAETGEALFCDNVTRNGAGSLWLGQEGLVTNLTDNIGSRHWEGIDLSANYLMEIGEGTLSFSANGSISLKKEYDPITGFGLDYDCSGVVSVDCFAQPEWRHTASVSYSIDDWAVTGKWRYYGEVGYEGDTDTLLIEEGGIEAYNYFDVSASYQVNENLSVQAVVNNIFDEEPPLVGGTISSNANTVAGFYDSLGRYLHVSATLKF